jgi:hypothetical protein
MTVPRDADPHNKAGIHGQLDLHPTYHPGPQNGQRKS